VEPLCVCVCVCGAAPSMAPTHLHKVPHDLECWCRRAQQPLKGQRARQLSQLRGGVHSGNSQVVQLERNTHAAVAARPRHLWLW
jgi:hypothetical protein